MIRHIYIVLGIALLVPPELLGQIPPPQRILLYAEESPGEPPRCGESMATLGDLDGDGTIEIAVGCPRDDTEGENFGNVRILSLKEDGTVERSHKIGHNLGGLPAVLDEHELFGQSMTTIGDLDGDGVTDLAVASINGSRCPGKGRCLNFGAGAVWVLFLNADATVKRFQKVDSDNGGFQEILGRMDSFASAVANIGDLDGDGVIDLAVGAYGDDGLSINDPGAVWILFMKRDGTVKSHAKISSRTPGFEGALSAFDNFGWSVEGLGDLDGDAVPDLAVSSTNCADFAPGASVPGPSFAAEELWILFLNRDGSLKGSHNAISSDDGVIVPAGPFLNDLEENDAICGLEAPGDLNLDGIPDLLLGLPGDLGQQRLMEGAFWILYLAPDGSVQSAQKVSAAEGNFGATMGLGGHFGRSTSVLGDLNKDGLLDVAVSAAWDSTSGARGAVWIYFGLESLPPRIVVQPENSVLPSVGSDLTVEAQIMGIGGVDPEIRFRRGGDPTFFSATMQPDNGLYRFAIPAFAVSSRGIDYVVSAENRRGDGSESSLQSARVYVPNGYPTVLGGGVDGTSYRLFSVPGELTETGARAALEDDLGPYDVSEWRFYGLETGTQLVELSEEDLVFEPGRAFWMLTRAENVSVNPGAGTSIRTDLPYPVRLTVGWNLVGNPFSFEIPVSNLGTGSGRPPELWAYDGSWNVETTAIAPLSGYALFSDGVDTLWIDPDLSPANVEAGTVQTVDPTSVAKHRQQLEALFWTQSPESGVGGPASVTAYPNPFRDAISIDFELTVDAEVTLSIHDLLGRRVATLLDDAIETAGRHTVRWDGHDSSGSKLAAGTYFYRISASQVERTGAIVLAK